MYSVNLSGEHTCWAISKLKCIVISFAFAGRHAFTGGTVSWSSTVNVFFKTSLEGASVVRSLLCG